MPQQSVLRIVKRWRRYEERGDWSPIPSQTRGLYVLYRRRGNNFEVVYIGVAGAKASQMTGVVSRLRAHHRNKEDWTHYSVFEVHDNVTRDEILELEALLLGIFRHDPRIKLANVQRGSRKLYRLRKRSQWRNA